MVEHTSPQRFIEDRPGGRTNTVPVAEDMDDADMDVAPPAYGDHHDQLQFSQAGFNADAAVTADGRVNIHINEKNNRLSDLLAPALKRQLRTETQLSSGPLPPAYIPTSLGGLPGQTPPPRLNVVIQIVGSRGDVQPFVALGQVLRDTYGHRVRLATHATFRSFVEENGLEFFSIGGDPAQLMAFMVKNPGLMPGLDSLKSGDIKKRRREIQEILMGCWRSCIEAGDGMGLAPSQHMRDEPVDEQFSLPGEPGNRPFVADAIIANPPSFAHIHIAEKLGIPLHMMFTMPWTPTRAFPHPLADVVATNADAAITNYVSYALVEMMTWQGLGDVINRFRSHTLELEPISLLWGPGLLNRLRIPATYCWSPALTPKPVDWPAEVTVSGFYFLNLESNYTPEPELAAFLAAGPPPVYIGFGSIVVDDPDKLTQTVFSAIIKSGVRAVVSKGWGGIGGDAAGVPEGVFMIGNCPHDWLFKHVSAVVHHGGAGTTAAGIMAGRPTVVVPFFGDQIFWGSMVARAGAGPAPIPHKKLTADRLASAIEFALQAQTRARARELGGKIKQEKGADVGGKTFHQFLNTDNMRCSLVPSRVAVWRVRRSQVRLSALAAAVLVKQGWLKYRDLKLYRPIEYNTDEQPWDPISAVIIALLGDVGAFTMALADFPREVFKGAQGKDKGKGKDARDGSLKTYDSISVSASKTSLGGGSASHRRADSGPESINLPLPAPETARASAESLPSQSSTSAGLAQPARASGTPPPPLSRSASSPDRPSTPINLEVAAAAGKGAGRIVGAGMKFYANTCLGLARGFRNAPKLYNDDTVRPPEKVTGLASGFRVAGKEFGLGLYDGVSGLVTQPWRGAEKEGGLGFVKGIGKGLGGVFLKSASAAFAIPAYTMQGVRAEVRNMFARSSTNYIIASRVLLGEEDLAAATPAERKDVLARWHTKSEELKGYYRLKQQESERALAAATAAQAEEEQRRPEREEGTAGSSATRSKRLSLPRELWSRRRSRSRSNTGGGGGGDTTPATTPAVSSASVFTLDDDEALERAIQQSVEQTSTGDREEDARVEAAVRASMMEMRRAAQQQQQKQQQQQEQQKAPPDTSTGEGTHWIAEQKTAHGGIGSGVPTDEEWTNVSDEEYQALIEEAVRQSLRQHEPKLNWQQQQQQQQQQQWDKEGTEPRNNEPPVTTPRELPGDDPNLTRQDNNRHPDIAMAGNAAVPRAGGGGHGHGHGQEEEEDDDDAQLRRAIQESEREHRARTDELARQRTEEEIVLEYVKRQSLAEEEFRRRKWMGEGGGSGGEAEKGRAVAGGESDEHEEDEELRRAIEESLKISGGFAGGGGGSGAGPSATWNG